MLLRHYRLAERAGWVSPAPDGALDPAGAGAALLTCSHPLQQHRLDATAAALLRGLQGGAPLEHLTTGAGAAWVDYLERLRGQGCLRAHYQLQVPQDWSRANWPDVEVVLPVLNNPAGVARCLDALAAQELPGQAGAYPRLRVTVVDDGSTPALTLPQRFADAATLPCRVLRLPRNAGPATARNLGWQTSWPTADAHAPAEPPGAAGAVGASVVAFLDSDCVPGKHWVATGALLVADPLVQGVATRTAALETHRLLGRYESQCSSLFLGHRSGPVGGQWGVAPYLPSCNLLLRRSALQAVQGFTNALRFGEDVELCERLMAAGQRLFYWAEAPSPPLAEASRQSGHAGDAGDGRAEGAVLDAAVAHDHRTGWLAFMARRRAYGRTQSWLSRYAPAATGRLRSGRWLLLPYQGAWALLVLAAVQWGAPASPGWGGVWALAALALLLAEGARALLNSKVRPLLGAVLGTVNSSAKGSALPHPVPLRTHLAAALRRLGAGLLQSARHGVRQSLVLWIPLLVLMPRLLPVALLVFAVGAGAEALSRQVRWRALPRWEFALAFAADALAYSLGRWEGVVLGAPRAVQRRTQPAKSPR